MADNNIEKLVKEEGEKTRDHFDVVAEDLKEDIKQVAEGVLTNTQRLEKLADVPDKLDKIDGRLDVIETTLEAVNLPVLKEKVLTLEKRVSTLEAKVKQ